jgi:glycosyltransferase involved in cell wall biosynthesis
MPRISIVTISYNQLDYLPRCISSISKQGFSDYEHIIVDPGSTDGSRDWLQREASANSRLRLVFKKDNGPADGLNNGLAACTGDIFLYLNSDDELAPGALAKVDALHQLHPDVDIIVGNGWTIDASDKPIKHIRSDVFTPVRYALSIGNVLQQSTSYKSRLFDRGLRFNPSNKSMWDTELLFDAFSMGARFKNVDEDLSFFRLHSESITVSGRHNAEIRKHRDRLVTAAQGHWFRSISKPLSYPCRAYKKAKGLYVATRKAATYSGSSVSLDVSESK